MTKTLKIGIVGGSIAGCSAAVLMSRAGHDVTIFERSRGRLRGRGGGISTPDSTFQSLVEQQMVDADFPRTAVSEMPFVGRASPDDDTGHTAWSLPVDLVCFHWGTLWENLRKRVPDADYLEGRHVRGAITQDGKRVALELQDGTSQIFDLVLFADGYQSLGRSLLHENADLKYRGYALWRGLLPESSLAESEPLEGKMARLCFADLDGHLVIYFVPGFDGSTRRGERLCNWAAYIPIDSADLPEFMVDRDGKHHVGSLPPGSLRRESEESLAEQMTNNLPGYYADIISRTKDTYVQLIYTADVDAYARNRMCLLGDAGSVIQPFTISGIFKGFHNAKDLASSLREKGVDDGMASWSSAQSERSKRILAVGEQMEQALIWNPPDFASIDAEATAAWWESTVTFGDDFSY